MFSQSQEVPCHERCSSSPQDSTSLNRNRLVGFLRWVADVLLLQPTLRHKHLCDTGLAGLRRTPSAPVLLVWPFSVVAKLLSQLCPTSILVWVLLDLSKGLPSHCSGQSPVGKSCRTQEIL